MIVFVDEAGDTGFKLNQGSSEFFIITLVIFDQNDEAAACDQRITLLRRELGLAKEFEFHFNETPDFVKRNFFKAIVPYSFFYVTTIKVKIQDSKKTNLIQLVDMVCGAVALSLKSPKERFWEYRRLIGHRELLAKVWPPPMFVEKDET